MSGPGARRLKFEDEESAAPPSPGIIERLANAVLIILTVLGYPFALHLAAQASSDFIITHFNGQCVDSTRTIQNFGCLVAYLFPLLWHFRKDLMGTDGLGAPVADVEFHAKLALRQVCCGVLVMLLVFKAMAVACRAETGASTLMDYV